MQSADSPSAGNTEIQKKIQMEALLEPGYNLNGGKTEIWRQSKWWQY